MSCHPVRQSGLGCKYHLCIYYALSEGRSIEPSTLPHAPDGDPQPNVEYPYLSFR